jgi:hypothetical protein
MFPLGLFFLEQVPSTAAASIGRIFVFYTLLRVMLMIVRGVMLIIMLMIVRRVVLMIRLIVF